MPLRLGHPYPITLDPTRRVENLRYLKLATADELEMHHFSFVRDFPRGIDAKLANVSNKGNFFSAKSSRETRDGDNSDDGGGGGGDAAARFLQFFSAFDATTVRGRRRCVSAHCYMHSLFRSYSHEKTLAFRKNVHD